MSPARNTPVPIPRPRADIAQLCQCHAREYVTAAVVAEVERCQEAGARVTESTIRESEVVALTQLVAGVQAALAELRAEVELGGWWARLWRWWRRPAKGGV